MRVRAGANDVHVDFVFNNARSYTGTVKSAMTMSGRSTTASKKIEGRWMSSICTRKRAAQPGGQKQAPCYPRRYPAK